MKANSFQTIVKGFLLILVSHMAINNLIEKGNSILFNLSDILNNNLKKEHENDTVEQKNMIINQHIEIESDISSDDLLDVANKLSKDKNYTNVFNKPVQDNLPLKNNKEEQERQLLGTTYHSKQDLEQIEPTQLQPEPKLKNVSEMEEEEKNNFKKHLQKIAKAQDNADRTGANSFSSNKNQEEQNKLLNIKNEPKTDVSFKKITKRQLQSKTIDKITKEGIFYSKDTNTIKPDRWVYSDENIMNGGDFGGILGYDNMDVNYGAL